MRASWIGLALALTVTSCLKTDDAGDEAASKAAQKAEEAGNGDAEAAPVPEKLPDAAELLEKSVAASGGREKIAAIKSFHFEGKVVAPKLNITGHVETWWKGGDFYMVQSIEGIGTNKSGKDGAVIWTEEPINGLRKLAGQEAEQHSWASSLLLAADWEKHFAKAETVAARKEDGKDVHDIKLTSDSGAELTLTIDATSNLVTAQAFAVVNPMGKTPVKMALEDYREVEGIKIPFRQESDLGVLQLAQEITQVDLNVDVDSAKFKMPVGETAVVKGDGAPDPKAAPRVEAAPGG